MALTITDDTHDGITRLAVTGEGRFPELIGAVRGALDAARRQGAGRLLIDVRAATGLGVPSLSERHWLVREWVAVADNRMRIAMVVPVQMIDPEQFGVVAAGNFGISAAVFADDAPARVWLLREAER